MSTISDRVRELIERFYGGNVTTAAKAAKVPPRSLARLAAGGTSSKAEMVANLAEHFGTTERWLLRGEGAPPTGPASVGYPASQFERWHALLETLQLEPHVEHAWRQLPSSISLASQFLGVSKAGVRGVTPAMLSAKAREVWAWTIFLEEWISLQGATAVREKMSEPAAVNAARVGFNWYSVVLMTEEPQFPGMIGALADKHGGSEEKAVNLSFARERTT